MITTKQRRDILRAFDQDHAKDEVAVVEEHGQTWVTCTNGEGERETYIVQHAHADHHPAYVSGQYAFLPVPR